MAWLLDQPQNDIALGGLDNWSGVLILGVVLTAPEERNSALSGEAIDPEIYLFEGFRHWDLRGLLDLPEPGVLHGLGGNSC